MRIAVFETTEQKESYDRLFEAVKDVASAFEVNPEGFVNTVMQAAADAINDLTVES